MRATDRKLIELDLKDRLDKLEGYGLMHPHDAFGEVLVILKLIVKLTVDNRR